MNLISPPNIIKKFHKKLTWNIKTDTKQIFLTFDDCQCEDLTYWVLELLKRHNIEATFFCTGKYVENTNIVSYILKNNHSIGNHGYQHFNGYKTKTTKYISNVLKCSGIIDSELFRPPYGKLKSRQSKILLKNYKIIMWDVLSYDFDAKTTPQQCFENVKKHTKPGSIVVFHTNSKARKNIQYTLPATIEYFTKKGYKFNKLSMK